MRSRSPSPGPGPGNKTTAPTWSRRTGPGSVNWSATCRYDTAAELEKLNEIWELDRIFTNYLLPQQKLIAKHATARKSSRNMIRATPHQRALRHPTMRKRPIIRMNAAFKRIKPAACPARSWP